MSRYFLFLFSLLVSPLSFSADWQTHSSDFAKVEVESKLWVNDTYFITRLDVSSACTLAETSQSNKVLDTYKRTYGFRYPEGTEWRFVTTGSCDTGGYPMDESRVYKPSPWVVTVSSPLDIQYKLPGSGGKTPEQCLAEPPIDGTFNNVFRRDGGYFINYNGCIYAASGVTVCPGEGDLICSSTWVPNGEIPSPDLSPSKPVDDSDGDSLTKSDVTEAIENASPRLVNDFFDKFTEPDTLPFDAKENEDKVLAKSKDLTSSIYDISRGAVRFADPSACSDDSCALGSGSSNLDSAIQWSSGRLSIDENSNGSDWEAFLSFGGARPIIPSGNGCRDFVMYPGKKWEIVIGCDVLIDIKNILTWVMYILTFWFSFSSLTSLLRKGQGE